MKKLLQTCGSSTRDQWIPGVTFFPGTSIFLLLCCSLKYKIHEELLHLNPLRNNPLLLSELLNPRGAPSGRQLLCSALHWQWLSPTSPMSQGRKSPQEQLAGSALIHTASVCPLPFSFWLLPRLRELLSPYTGSWGLKLNPAHSVLCSSSYHYKCTLPEKQKKKRKELKKGMESSRNPIFAKLLHGEIISLFLFFFFLGENWRED